MTHEAKCFKDYQDLGKCYSYFNSIFNDIRFDFYHYKGEFKSKIDNIEDPILRHIALYLVENYCSSKKYFSTDGTWKNNDACDSLNIWLDYKKNYFTHARLCKGNVQLWNKTIEPIWEELEKKAQEENNGSPKKWCARNNHFRGHLELPEKLKSPRCYKHIPNEYECFLPFPPNMCNLKNSCTNEKLKKFYEKCKQNNNGKDFTDFSYLFSKVIDHGVSP
ncbi:variable surface protein, partial [Plasmodium gonderi]